MKTRHSNYSVTHEESWIDDNRISHDRRAVSAEQTISERKTTYDAHTQVWVYI